MVVSMINNEVLSPYKQTLTLVNKKSRAINVSYLNDYSYLCDN